LDEFTLDLYPGSNTSNSQSTHNCRYHEARPFTSNISPIKTPSASNSKPTITNMYATAILLAGLSALAAASPINIPKPEATGILPPFPIGSGSPPGGFPVPTGAPRPTAVPVPRPIGSAACPTNGQLVCNGPDQWGLCNWGQVQFQRVAAGTQCLDGEIVFAPGFGINA
jgi:hypothetical protein